MNVLIVNTSERIGGAAIAANRLMDALLHQHVDAHLLVRDRQTDRIPVSAVRQTWLLPLKFLWERGLIFLCNGFSTKRLWKVDLANTGTDITSLPEFQRADVVHLHWVNQSFLSLSDLGRIFRSGKRVVVTLHDQWYVTGICHHAQDCLRYEQGCARCPQLGDRHLGPDLAARAYRRKQALYAGARLTFVGCSQWIADTARHSLLTRGQRVVSIPNPIDTTLFRPVDRAAARQRLGLPPDRPLVLFGSRRVTDPNKGFRYFVEACQMLKERCPDLGVGLVVVGEDSEKGCGGLPLDVFPVSYVKKELQMVDIYNAVDAYVTPSLFENLPNTIMEALACGTPCVGFRTGGIPEMIQHGENGYVARYRDAADLAAGIVWTLAPQRHDVLACNARKFALDHYSEERVAREFIKLYQSLG